MEALQASLAERTEDKKRPQTRKKPASRRKAA
jgi:hypothetical protein